MEAKNIGRVLTGGLIATELLGVLVEKEILTDVDVCRLLMKARKAIERTPKGQKSSCSQPAGEGGGNAIRSILNRFADDRPRRRRQMVRRNQPLAVRQVNFARVYLLSRVERRCRERHAVGLASKCPLEIRPHALLRCHWA